MESVACHDWDSPFLSAVGHELEREEETLRMHGAYERFAKDCMGVIECQLVS
jgi:hypothetical protein